MDRSITAMLLLTLTALCACQSKIEKQQKAAKPKQAPPHTTVVQNKKEQPAHTAKMTFVKYIDDGDYFQLIARKGDSTFSFINETDPSRSLNRGDQIQITWKDGTVTMPGDNDVEAPAQLLRYVKKISDGPVSVFRKVYGKKLKYTWPTDEHFTSSYLDKLYMQTEYYLSKTTNPLLQLAIKNQDQLTYSIESRERNNHNYKVIGIAPIGTNGANVVQWLYIGDEEDDQIYEYDLPEDRLVPFD
ncbi:hypothetical protein FPZ43_16640 [Mucilaginibacter pallidiroseus]|uniref:Uncharacterized protein n=1 Tax=Mucilaginibacter pallidiroseus TaxID=2599295 RepID=A0A563U3I5_9SPHI|nr:hypothetical protein [Mucilaginibacter pallidiroseus]TWR25907.1 hypothetical protein FPZ43_16640 [Mucilaginibacter pallidiroseus]